ncbi:hypothetical protein PLICRDRAFT_499963 [Plicaturopsis crispa FD-325 SS-3]|nr:hypothetical protein PLICRDRAFT_499963 [Plicaturopsis crispa FD-325 SS-3]
MALSIYPHGALTLVFSILCIVSSLAHAQTVTVSADDSRISYTGDWVDQDNGGHKFAGDTGCSMSFSFQGSAVSYHSVHNFNGGVARLSVDGDGVTEVDESSGTTKGADPVQAVLYSRQGLDASKTHTLNLQWVGPGSFGGGYVELYSLEYTPGGTTASNSPSAQASPQTTTKVATTTAEGQTVTATATATGAGQTVTQVSSQPNGASQNSATSLDASDLQLPREVARLPGP